MLAHIQNRMDYVKDMIADSEAGVERYKGQGRTHGAVTSLEVQCHLRGELVFLTLARELYIRKHGAGSGEPCSHCHCEALGGYRHRGKVLRRGCMEEIRAETGSP